MIRCQLPFFSAHLFIALCFASSSLTTPDAHAQSAGSDEVSESFGQSDQSPDFKRIASLYTAKCSHCHGKDGRGVPDGDVKPLRLNQSVDDLTKLIVETMPEDDPESCVGEEARQIATWIHSHFSAESPVVGPRISRLTVSQYRNAVADIIGRFPTKEAPDFLVGDEDDYLPKRSSSDPSTPGLRGEYYQSLGSSKANRLGHFRSDTRLEFDFGNGSPVASISADQFAIIWTGGVEAVHSGFYEFRLRTGNGARLYLNSDPMRRRRNLRDETSTGGQQELIDTWVGSKSLSEKSARVYLLGGRRYSIRLEFFKYFEDEASVTLEWKPPHGTWSVLDYNDTTTAVPGRVFVATTPFPADDQSLGYTRGNSVSSQWQDATMNGAIEAATEVVDRLPFLAGFRANGPEEQGDDEWNRRSKAERESERAIRTARVKEFVLEFASVAYRRPLTKNERQLILNMVEADPDNDEAGVRRVVIMVLMSPHFLYPDLTPNEGKPSPYVVASRLSFGLWDSVPDAESIAAAGRNELRSFSQIERHARRMLRDPRAKARMRHFFNDWLELEYRDLAKDKELFPEFDEAVIADLRRSLELFIDRVVWSRRSDYRQLLQADYLMLNSRLAALYRPDQKQAEPKKLDRSEVSRRAARRQFASEFQPVDFPSDRRSGVLTHPYLLSAYAYHNNTSPIHRGVFLTRNIVGRALSPPPIAVAFKDDEFSPDLTMREKITQLTRDTACMSCHSVINPLGFTLENFDAVGRWRVTDNQKPVDTASEYTTASGEKLRLASARDVADIAVTSASAQRSFITHVFQHVVKRSPRDMHPELLEKLRARFVKDDFNIQRLWARIAAIGAAESLVDLPTLLAEISS